LQGRFAEAETQFREVLRQVPSHVATHERLGNLLLGQGRNVEALPHLAAGLSGVNGLANLGTALLLTGQAREALVPLSRAVALDPRHPHARWMLGRALAMEGRLPDAVAELEQAVALAPNDPAARADLETVRSRFTSVP
jgi:Flp pilus assembly protein TadD